MSIDKIKQISTKKGDKGSSSNYSRQIFKKSDILFETLGTMDELSSFLGLSYHYTHYEDIKTVQKHLQNINSILATDPTSALYPKLTQISENDIAWIEDSMQTTLDIKPIEPRFTLPGSEKTLTGAYFDVSRALCRRAERRIIQFSELHEREDLSLVKQFVNRLSDYLFVLSCNL